ncbi:MAG: hypothetical protein HUU60_00530 [Armatimonadetes bacterium]|nr:hypothetical protein [Armatimonadota bacterium]
MSGSKRVLFAHKSEEEFARLLDFYQVRWEYEPRTFVLEAADDGSPVESFTPDFYLPDHDLYLELTTRRGNLSRRKLRKIEKLMQAYPSIRARLIDPAQFDAIMLGRENDWRQPEDETP